MTIAMLAVVVGFVLILVLLAVARRRQSGPRGRRREATGEANTTAFYLGSEAGSCESSADGGGSCDGGGGD